MDKEKASLITVICLLQYDIDNDSVETSNECTAWIKSGGNEGGNQKYIHSYKNTKRSQLQSNQLTKDIIMSNQYSPLRIDEPQSTINVSSNNCSDDEKSNREVAPAKKPQD